MSDYYTPASPENIVERPLSKGVVLNSPPQGMDTGSFLRLREFVTYPEGMKRTGNISHWGQGWTVDYPPVTGFWKLWRTSGVGYAVVSDRKFIYTMGQDGLTGVYDTYSDGSLSVSGAVATGNGTAWDTDVNAGDVVVLDADGSGDGPEEAIITSVDSATQVTFVEAPTGTYSAGTDYKLRKAFRTLCSQDRVDSGTSGVAARSAIMSVAADDYLIFVDGSRHPRAFNGTTFEQFGELEIIPSCIAYFRDRLHFGNIVSGSEYSRYQIQWSDVGSGNLDIISAGSYQSLPYQQGALRALVPMGGGNLVAFFDDAVYIGTPTNSSDIPVDYDQIDSGNVGIAGPRAYANALDGIFFVGLTNVYYLSNDGLEAIGDSIAREVLTNCKYPQYISVVSDPFNERVVFGFPRNGEEIESLWSFQWKTMAWSEERVNCSCLGHFMVEYPYTVDGLDALKQRDDSTPITIDTLTDRFGSIDEMSSVEGDTGVFVGRFGTGSIDLIHSNGTNPLGEFITRDFDFGLADTNKTVTKLGLKIDRNLDADLTFVVKISGDRGVTWKNVGRLRIPSGDSEGKVDFRYTNALARFWLKQESLTEPYVVEEYTLRVRSRGREDKYV